MARLRIMVTLVLFLPISLLSGSVCLSFLNDDAALRETLALLRQAGCKEDSVAAFQKVVERYNSTPLQFNLSKFPRAQHGYYIFKSSSQLLAVLPHRLWDIPHPFEFNCFDTVIILANGKFRTDLHPDDHPSEFLPALTVPNDGLFYGHAATAREAFDFSYPAWYRDASDRYIPSSMIDARINLTAAMYCFHARPLSTNQQEVSEQVINILRESWKHQAIAFPSNCQVVLCHGVTLTNHLFATAHAGLLFPVRNGYTYLEKAGGSGPFVRLDFDDRVDLLTYLGGKFEKTMADYIFATFNDSKIELLPVGVYYDTNTPPGIR
jgi:hypothetical protein